MNIIYYQRCIIPIQTILENWRIKFYEKLSADIIITQNSIYYIIERYIFMFENIKENYCHQTLDKINTLYIYIDNSKKGIWVFYKIDLYVVFVYQIKLRAKPKLSQTKSITRLFFQHQQLHFGIHIYMKYKI